MAFDKEQVAAIYLNDGIFCSNCITDEKWNLLTGVRVITRQEADENDKIFFCDRY
ncbi:MAG: hypothetical protein KGY56_12715 [Desulfobacterales bacterium]|nr:hypothetical protein [Desulfobacterales bacterium]